MPLAISPIPEISISLASPEEPVPEPFSPFSPGFSTGPCSPVPNDDGWRANLLSPPPTMSPRNLSPLRPLDSPVKGQGLERGRFEALLRASRERNTVLGNKKSVDLRKEIAIKAHKSKQLERRELFLSKVRAPPSPTATLTPKTPPESPAIFHYTLPSPGLDSPIAVFESLSSGKPATTAPKPWVEQVDFRLPDDPARMLALRTAPVLGHRNPRPLPSLEQITARLSSHVVAPESPAVQSARLPAFLQSGRRSSLPLQVKKQVSEEVLEEQEEVLLPPPTVRVYAPPPPKVRPPLPTAVGRLHFPSRPAPVPEVEVKLAPMRQERRPLTIRAPKPCLPPASPTLSPVPKLQITTTLVPRTATLSPTVFTESNLRALNLCMKRVDTDKVVPPSVVPSTREDTARKMLTRLRRRTLPPNAADALRALGSQADGDERKLRRRSAPPELQERERTGFTHPVLALPGAF